MFPVGSVQVRHWDTPDEATRVSLEEHVVVHMFPVREVLFLAVCLTKNIGSLQLNNWKIMFMV